MHSTAPLPSHCSSLALAALGLFALTPRALCAQEDREVDASNVSIWLHGQTPAQLDALDKNYWRVVNLEVASAAPLTFRAALVRNDGTPLSRAWWFYSNQTQFEMLGKTLQHVARLTDLEPYVVNGEIRYAGVMVTNQGVNQKPVYVQFATNPTLLQQHLSNDNARLFDIDSVVLGGQRFYSALTVRNTGAEARTWNWALGQSAAQIETMAQQGMRVIDIERNGASNYDVVVQQRGGVADWRYYSLSQVEVEQRLLNNGARLIDFEAYSFNGATVYDVVMLNNVNAVEERVGALMRAQTDGWVGSAVRGVGNGLYYAALNNGRSFDPGTSLALLHSAHAVRQIATNNGSFTQQVQYYLGSSGQACPSNTNLTVNTLGLVTVNALNGGYAEIKALANLYSHAAIAATATAMDMDETDINGYVGCTANASSLRDFTDFFRRVDAGYLLNSTSDFLTLLDRPFYGTGYVQGRLKQIIDQEAAAINLNSSLRNSFVEQMRVYGVSNAQQTAGGHQRSHVAMIALPVYGNGGINLHEYVCATFVADAATATGANEAALIGATEPMRELINAALVTWRNHVVGWRVVYGTGCGGANGIPQQQGFGVPEIGQTLNYVMSSARPNAPFVMFLGVSRTSVQGVPLPFNLAGFGAPNCNLYTDLSVTLHGAVNGTGTAARVFTVPVASNLITSQFYTQFAALDPTANALGLAMTAGLETRLGGQR